MRRWASLGMLVLVLLAWATPGFAVSRPSKARSLRALAVRAQNNSLKYLHTTWFTANYKYSTVPIASIVATDATGTIEVLNPSRGFSAASSDQIVSLEPLAFTPALASAGPVPGTTRKQASASYATALALANGTYSASRTGVSPEEAMRRTVAWTNALAISHSRHEWGSSWQSALWTYYMAAGSKRIWSSLPTCTQELVRQSVAEEADRLLAIPPPYYRNARGKILRPGYSPAADNAWNASLLLLASRMYASDDATKAAQWEAQGRRYALTAYATPSQVGRDPRILGSNLNSNGTVTNHRRIHPDYIATSGEMEVKYVLTAAWSHTPVARECYNGLTKAWSGLTQTRFRVVQPYVKPGGTIYRTGWRGAATAKVYYPQGADWSYKRRHNFALMDVSMFVAGHDYSYRWAKVHLYYVLAQQARHRDGRVFSSGETKFPEDEQFAAACAAEMVESLGLVR